MDHKITLFSLPYKLYRGAKVPYNAVHERLESAANYEPKQGDVFINTFPKCGTTWMQHIVYLIMNGGIPAKDATEILDKIPFPEQDGFPNENWMMAVKYHLPYHLVPHSETAKYIVVARNPMDTCVSYYHFLKSLPDYDIRDFNEFFEAFMSGELPYGDYLDYLIPWYQHRNDDNVLFMTYEYMKSNHERAIRDIASFLGKSSILQNPEFIKDVIRYSSISHMRPLIDGAEGILNSYLKTNFENFQKRNEIDELEMATKIRQQPVMIRRGCIGDWKNCFSKQQEDRMRLKMIEKLKFTNLANEWDLAM